MYLMLCTWPDLAYAVGALGKFSSNSRQPHMNAVKRLLRYVSKTRAQGLHFGPFTQDSTPVAYVFSDADWAGDPNKRRRTGAYLCTICDQRSNSVHTAVSWSSKQQAMVALSSTESESMALTQACKEVICVQRFMQELATITGQGGCTGPITIFADNQVSMALAKNPEFYSRNKHISIQQHCIREKVQVDEVQLKHLPMGDILADLLIKFITGRTGPENTGPQPFSPLHPTQRPTAGCLFRHSLPLSPLRPQPHPFPRQVAVKNSW